MQRGCWIVFAVLFTLIAGAIAWTTFAFHRRQQQFADAQKIVQSRGGSLSFDLVDGNYVLELSGNAATDQTIRRILPTLKPLPTGFTLFGPGESRLFWVTLEDSLITNDGLRNLSALRVSWLQITGAHLTDAAVPTLIAMDELSGIMLSRVQLTDDGITTLCRGKPAATIMVDGRECMAEPTAPLERSDRPTSAAR